MEVSDSRIAIIIPAYNEEATIADVVSGFHHAAPNAELVVVDNNSNDATQALAQKAFTDLSIDGRILFEKRQGKSAAVRKAFREIEADVYVMVDADLTYSPDDLGSLLTPVLNGDADMVVGDRLSLGAYRESKSQRFHSLGNRLVRNATNVLFRSDLKDILSGYRVMSRKFVKLFPILSEGFGLETEMTIHALDKQFTVEEIPIQYLPRPEGSDSKISTISDGWLVMRLIFYLYRTYRPLKFFMALSFVFAILGVLVAIPVVLEWLTTGLIYRIPSAVLATGLEIFAIVFFSLGLILETVVRNHRYTYELRSIDYHDDAE